MIAKLNGIIDEIGSDQVILLVGGVGYAVHVSERTLALCTRQQPQSLAH